MVIKKLFNSILGKNKSLDYSANDTVIPAEEFQKEKNAQAIDQLMHDFYDVFSAKEFKIIIPQKYIDVLSAKGTKDQKSAIYTLHHYETGIKGKYKNYPIPSWYAKIYDLVTQMRSIDREKAREISDQLAAFATKLDNILTKFNKESVEEVFTHIIPQIKNNSVSFETFKYFSDVNINHMLVAIPKYNQEVRDQGFIHKREFQYANTYVYVKEDYIELFDYVMNYPLVEITFISQHTAYVRNLFARLRL